jgi:hypothetical protein
MDPGRIPHSIDPAWLCITEVDVVIYSCKTETSDHEVVQCQAHEVPALRVPAAAPHADLYTVAYERSRESFTNE